MFALLFVLLLFGPPQEPRVVEVTIAGSEDDRDRAVERIRSFLADDPISLELTMVDAIDTDDVLAVSSEQDGTLAYVVVQVADDEVRVYVIDGRRERVMMRRIVPTHGVDEVVLETIAYTVETNLLGLLAGGSIGVTMSEARAGALSGGAKSELGTRAEPSAEAPNVASAPDRSEGRTARVAERRRNRSEARAARRARGRGLDRRSERERTDELALPREPQEGEGEPANVAVGVDLGYQLRAWSTAPILQHGPLATFSIGRGFARARGGAALEIGGLFSRRIGDDDAGVGLRVHTATIRGLAQLVARPESVASGVFAAGVGVEIQREIPVALTPTAEPFRPTTRPLPVVSVRAALRLRGLEVDGHRLLIGFGATLDVMLRGVRYYEKDTDRHLLTPWMVRPGVAITFGWEHVAAVADDRRSRSTRRARPRTQRE